MNARPEEAPAAPATEPRALTPREIVAELDKHIIGQNDA